MLYDQTRPSGKVAELWFSDSKRNLFIFGKYMVHKYTTNKWALSFKQKELFFNCWEKSA